MHSGRSGYLWDIDRMDIRITLNLIYSTFKFLSDLDRLECIAFIKTPLKVYYSMWTLFFTFLISKFCSFQEWSTNSCRGNSGYHWVVWRLVHTYFIHWSYFISSYLTKTLSITKIISWCVWPLFIYLMKTRYIIKKLAIP